MDAAAALLLLLLLLFRVSQHAATKQAASELRASACDGSASNIQASALFGRNRGRRLSEADTMGSH
jgi:hypothetical protein